MVTKVGMQDDFESAIKDLLELDFDAIEAYEAAINRIESQAYKDSLIRFKEDHVRHTEKISTLLKAHDKEAPTGPSGKQWLTKGKIVLANLMGDKAILYAMISNEIDTNTAYERLYYHDNKWPDAEEILREGLQDERRHKAWLEKAVES